MVMKIKNTGRKLIHQDFVYAIKSSFTHNLKEKIMEAQNETQQTQEEITHTEVPIDTDTKTTTRNDLQMINVKDFVHVDPDMIPFNDLQMTREKYLTIKLILKIYNSDSVEHAEDFANRLIAFARGE